MKIIRSTRHSLKFSNKIKLEKFGAFLSEYQRVGQFLIDEIWDNGYGEFNIKKDVLDIPKYIDYKQFKIETPLSARALSSLATQITGVISASTEKRRRKLWLFEKLEKEGKPNKNVKKQLASERFLIVKPKFSQTAELSSKCIDISHDVKHFNFFVRLKSLGKEYGHIKIPVKLTDRDTHWIKLGGTRLGSILFLKNELQIRYALEKEVKKNGLTLGADQGLKTVLTLSNGETSPEKDGHNHSLDSICSKLARKKKGSKAFGRAQEHRKNFINWSLNQLNFKDVKEIRLEKVININFGRRVSRKMQAWTNTEIRDKLLRLAEEQEVLVVLQDSTYRSQRCSCCGNVRKSNRKGKLYSCKHCGNTMDADLNAAKNHEINLPNLPFGIRNQKFNLKNGFFWNPLGITLYDGSELRVPASCKKE